MANNPPPGVQRQPTLTEQARHRIEKFEKDHEGDRLGAHRAAEVSFWNDWTRSGPDMVSREQLYAFAAIRCADLYHMTGGMGIQVPA